MRRLRKRPSPGAMGHVGEPCGDSLARRTYRDGHRRITWLRLELEGLELPYRYRDERDGTAAPRCEMPLSLARLGPRSSTFPHTHHAY